MLEIPLVFQIKFRGQQDFYFNNTIIQLSLLWLKISLHIYIYIYIYIYI